MCFEYERDRDAQEDEQAREEIRLLFERYRMARRREATVMADGRARRGACADAELTTRRRVPRA